MAGREHAFDAQARTGKAPAEVDNPAVAQQLANDKKWHPVNLDTGFQEAARADEAMQLIRGTLLPAYRRAVDALDARAALELAHHIGTAFQAAQHARRETTLAVNETTAETTPDPRVEQLRPLQRTLVADFDALAKNLAVSIGPQIFRGRAVLGAIFNPELGREPLPFIVSEAGTTVELIATVNKARSIAGVTGDECKKLTKDQSAAIAALVEPWRTRPVNFAFVASALQDDGIWQVISTVATPSGSTLAEVQNDVDQQIEQTGALNDVGSLDARGIESLFPSLRIGNAKITGVDESSAMLLFEKLQELAPGARAAILKKLAGGELLLQICAKLPWQYVKTLHDQITRIDHETAALLVPYYEDKGGGESLHAVYMDQSQAQLDNGNPVRAFGWFFLDFCHNTFTAGFHHEYSEDYDAYQQGLITEAQFKTKAYKALGKAAVVLGAAVATGGAVGAFAEGAAAGLGAAPGIAAITGGAAGGVAGAVGSHLAGDIYDQTLNGKQGFDDFSAYLKTAAIGGLTGTITAGISVGAGRYLQGANQRPIDVAAKNTKIAPVLERIRVAGMASGQTVRMKVSELVELIDSNFGGPGGPTAFAVATGDVRALPPEAEVDVRLRPLRSLTQPMQMSVDGKNGSKTTDPNSAPVVAIEQVEVSPSSAAKVTRGLDTPFRAPNPEHPPDPNVTAHMNKMHIDHNTDCSEIAWELRKVAGTGDIIEVTPKVRGTLQLPEYGKIEKDMFYHEVYTDGRYVYDPRLSDTPVPKGDWQRSILALNPGATIKWK